MDPSGVYGPRFTQTGPFSRAPAFFLQQLERKRAYEDVEEVAPVSTKRHLSDAETVFRLLLSEARLSAVLNGASDVRLPNGCRLRLCERVPNCDECVVVISARDERKDDSNVAMQGLLDAVRRALSAEQAARESTTTPPNSIYMICLLINRTQAGAVIGKGGILNKDIRERTGAYSKILTTEDIPVCALHNDRVVQVTGKVEQVMAGMEIIARQLRDNVPKERPGGPPPCLSVLSGFTLYYAHEAPPYIPATDYGRPIILPNAYQSTSFQISAPVNMFGARPSHAGYVPFTPSSGGQRMYSQPPIMYANQGRPPQFNGAGPTYYY